jgi:hypothetical protein
MENPPMAIGCCFKKDDLIRDIQRSYMKLSLFLIFIILQFLYKSNP